MTSWTRSSSVWELRLRRCRLVVLFVHGMPHIPIDDLGCGVEPGLCERLLLRSWRASDCPEDCSGKLLLAIVTGCELGHVTATWQLDRKRTRAEVGNQCLRSVRTTSIRVQSNVQALESLELDEALVPESVPDER